MWRTCPCVWHIVSVQEACMRPAAWIPDSLLHKLSSREWTNLPAALGPECWVQVGGWPG